MKIDGRRGVVNVAVVLSWRSDFHDSCNSSNGARALISVTEDFEVEEVSNRVAFRLFVGVDVDGIFHKTEIVPPATFAVVRILRGTSPVYMVISRISPGYLPENSDQA